MSGAYAVLHDPEGLMDAELPLDRAPHEASITALLAWKDPDLAPCDYEQIALQLTGRARAVAADVRRLAAAQPKSDGRGALAEVILREADGRLSAPLQGTARYVQNRARLVQALYTRLDRLTEPAPARAWARQAPYQAWLRQRPASKPSSTSAPRGAVLGRGGAVPT